MKIRKSVLIAGSILMLSACASQPVDTDAYDTPGFFMGFWNGITIGFSFIGHFFDNSIRIYAYPNSGGWYDFGFILGINALREGASKLGNSK